jgi:uncharacterized protein YxjI
MKNYKIKQKFWSLAGKFEIADSRGNLAYYVEGSFLKIPKHFIITRPDGSQVSKIQKVMWQFLPKFDVTLANGDSFRIAKALTLLKPRYTIENFDLDIQGDFWDMNFELTKNGLPVAQISQEWFKINSTYTIEVYEDSYSDLVISLVIAIDYVKAQQSASSASSGASN